MVPNQRTTVNLDVNWAALEQHAWKKFLPKIGALQTIADIRALLDDAPPLGSPSSRFYTNLADFLLTYRAPKEATAEELSLYIQLVERLDASGSLDVGIASGSLSALRRALEKPADV